MSQWRNNYLVKKKIKELNLFLADKHVVNFVFKIRSEVKTFKEEIIIETKEVITGVTNAYPEINKRKIENYIKKEDIKCEKYIRGESNRDGYSSLYTLIDSFHNKEYAVHLKQKHKEGEIKDFEIFYIQVLMDFTKVKNYVDGVNLKIKEFFEDYKATLKKIEEGPKTIKKLKQLR